MTTLRFPRIERMAAWTIMRKDLFVRARDHRAVIILLAMPLNFIAILGFSTGQMLGERDRHSVLRRVLADRSEGRDRNPEVPSRRA